MSALTKKLWEDPNYRNNMCDVIKKRWANLEYRKAIVEHSKSLWKDKEFVERMARSNENQLGKSSSLQVKLYSILSDLSIPHEEEYIDNRRNPKCRIGPYWFDCVIPRNNQPTLLIECQGDYWHSLSDTKARDTAKLSYLKNLPEYELKYLWEHEFKCKDRVVETIKYWLGVDNKQIEYKFDDVKILDCKAADYRLLLSKYHYLANAGRGGIAFGAYHQNNLIAVCVFSPLIRQNMPYDYKSTVELSRLCVHPHYQKKNFASWFISRCIKKLDPKYKTIISYCDTTFNHNGAVYKACNFEFDKEIPRSFAIVYKFLLKTLFKSLLIVFLSKKAFYKKEK
jgi:GNAT superfamily N-acetyltransferase